MEVDVKGREWAIFTLPDVVRNIFQSERIPRCILKRRLYLFPSLKFINEILNITLLIV